MFGVQKNMKKGVASSEYALLIGSISLLLAGAYAIFSEEIDASICGMTESASGFLTNEKIDLSCRVFPNDEGDGNTPSAGTGNRHWTEKVPFEEEPSVITRYGSSREDDRYTLGWTATERGDMTFEEDDSFSETLYARFEDLGEQSYRCALPENGAKCFTLVEGMPSGGDRNSPVRRMAIDANNTHMYFSGLNYGNLDINFKNLRGFGDLNAAGAPEGSQLRINAFGAQSVVRYPANAYLGLSNGNYYLKAGSRQANLFMQNARNHSETLITHPVDNTYRPGFSIVQIDSAHPQNQSVEFHCRASDDVEPSELHPQFTESNGPDYYNGYDEIEAKSSDGSSTFIRWYHWSDSAGGLQFLGRDEVCDPYSHDYNYRQYFTGLPAAPGLTRHEAAIDAKIDWELAEKSYTNNIVEGDEVLSQTRSLRFVFDEFTTHNRVAHRYCQYGIVAHACKTSISNMPVSTFDASYETLKLDGGGTERRYTGFPLGAWDLDIVNYPDKFSVVETMAAAVARTWAAHTSFRVSGNGGVVWLSAADDGANLHYTLQNGQFFVEGSDTGSSNNRTSSIKLTPAPIEEDTLVRVWRGEYEEADVKIVDRAAEAGAYTFYCSSHYPAVADYAEVNGINSEGLSPHNGVTRRAYDQIRGVATNGSTLTYRIYQKDAATRIFDELETLCDRDNRYFD